MRRKSPGEPELLPVAVMLPWRMEVRCVTDTDIENFEVQIADAVAGCDGRSKVDIDHRVSNDPDGRVRFTALLSWWEPRPNDHL